MERQEIRVLIRRGAQTRHARVSSSDMPELLEGRRLIYNNGGAQIWTA